MELNKLNRLASQTSTEARETQRDALANNAIDQLCQGSDSKSFFHEGRMRAKENERTILKK